MEALRAINSSSQLGRRLKCPGSALAEKGLPKLDSPWSAEGTLLHELDADPKKSRKDLDATQREALERNAALRQKFLDASLPRLGISEKAKCVHIIEREFILLDDDLEPVISHGDRVPGHPDHVYHYPEFKIAIIIDSKFGRIPVTAAWLNLQLRSYAVMLSDIYDLETVLVAITQPWAKSPDDLHSAELSKADMPQYKREIMDVIRATESPNAPRHASVESCTYCAACAYCPLAVSTASSLAEVKVTEISIAELEALGPDIELAKKVIEAWSKRMKYVAENFPDQLKLYELAKVKERRSIENVWMACQILKDHGIIADETEFIKKLAKVSVGDIEAKVVEDTKATSSSAELLIEKALGALIVKKPMERSLQKKTKSIHAK
jgi:hypothetical protein